MNHLNRLDAALGVREAVRNEAGLGKPALKRKLFTLELLLLFAAAFLRKHRARLEAEGTTSIPTEGGSRRAGDVGYDAAYDMRKILTAYPDADERRLLAGDGDFPADLDALHSWMDE